MPAFFSLELDTTPPNLHLSRMERSSAEMVVWYEVSETPGDAVADVEVDGGDIIHFDDEGDHVVGLVPWSVGGLFTIRGRDEVWNEVVQSFHIHPLAKPGGEMGEGSDGTIVESHRGGGRVTGPPTGSRGRIRHSGQGKLQ